MRKTIFWFGLIFTVYTVLPLPDDVSFASNTEPHIIVVKELCGSLRAGAQPNSVPFIRRILTFFIPNSSRGRDHCPKPNTRSLQFPYGSDSGNGGGNSKGQRSQAVPDREEWDSDPDNYRYDKNQEKKKKKDEDQDQCNETPVTVYEDSLKTVKPLKRITNTALKNNRVKKEYPKIKKRLEDGIHPLDLNKKSTGVKCNIPGKKNYYIIKTGSARYVLEYLETNDARVANILGIADRSNGSNLKALKNALEKEYGIELHYTDFN